MEQQTQAMDVPNLSSEAEGRLSVRDEFAARAMQGMMSFGGPDCNFVAYVSYDIVAQMAYDMAHAMMEERKQRLR